MSQELQVILEFIDKVHPDITLTENVIEKIHTELIQKGMKIQHATHTKTPKPFVNNGKLNNNI